MSRKSTSPFGAQTQNTPNPNRRSRDQTFEVCTKHLKARALFIMMSRLPHSAKAKDEEKEQLFASALDSFIPWAKGSYATANGTRLWAEAIARVDGTEELLEKMLAEITEPEVIRVKRGTALTARIDRKPVPLAPRQVYVLKVAGMALLLGILPKHVTSSNVKSGFAQDVVVGPQRIATRASYELVQRIFPSGMLAEFQTQFEAAAPKAKVQDEVDTGADVTELPAPAPAEGDTSADAAPVAEAC